jgi:hypothetical protein
MSEMPINEVLISILGMMKQQIIYMHRQHGWLIAIADAIREKPELKKALETHEFYDQGRRPDMQSSDVLTQNIDALIQQLRLR